MDDAGAAREAGSVDEANSVDRESVELADAYYAISDFLVNCRDADPELQKAYAAWVSFSFKCLQKREAEKRAALQRAVDEKAGGASVAPKDEAPAAARKRTN
ncbi:MAG: hypothetical protein AAF322_07455 [Pseudomonadota bacterium]